MHRVHTIIGWFLGLGALLFVLLLGGLFSGALTDDPPAVSPYASSGGDDGLEDDAPSYLPGGGDDEPADSTTSPTTVPATTAAPVAAAELAISGFSFGDPITVAAGTEVTITNEDGAPHTWTSRDGLWDSGSLRGGDTFSFVFDTPGSFEFLCTIHAQMTGTITVTG